MFDFFQALSDFLKSDLGKSWGWVILAAFIICICIVATIIYFVIDRFMVPAKFIEANNAKRDNQRLLQENEKLKEENEDLKQKLSHYKYLKAIYDKADDDFEDKALKQFVKE